MSQPVQTSNSEDRAVAEPAVPRIAPQRHIELVPIAPEALPQHVGAEGRPPVAVQPWWRRYGLFLGLFVLPVFAALLYFGLIASDIYTSEAKFLVRASARSVAGSLSAMMPGDSMSRAADETYAVSEYMLSRDAAAELAKTAGLRDVMDRSEADMFNRYPSWFGKENEEQFYRAYRRMVDVVPDGGTGISTLVVRAYRADDAQAVAKALIAAGEKFVNKLNLRSNEDAVKFSESMVKETQLRLSDVEARLAAYRNSQLVVDPEKESTQSLAILGKMTTEISRLEATLSQQMAMAPDSPAITPLRERIAAYRTEMQKQQKNVVGGADSIASKLQGYELLILERDLAGRALAVATASLESARQEAQSQRIYLQEVTEPNLPDQALQPKRLLAIFVVAFLSLCAYWIARSFIANTLDHQA